MKTIADLTFDDLRRIGKDAAAQAVADLRSAGVLRDDLRPAAKSKPTKEAARAIGGGARMADHT